MIPTLASKGHRRAVPALQRSPNLKGMVNLLLILKGIILLTLMGNLPRIQEGIQAVTKVKGNVLRVIVMGILAEIEYGKVQSEKWMWPLRRRPRSAALCPSRV